MFITMLVRLTFHFVLLQKVVVESDNSLNIANPSELEGLINSTVERLLTIYDADKIAKVDYALATSGKD